MHPLTRIRAKKRPSRPFEDAGDVECQRAVGVDRLELGGAEVGDGVGADGVAVGALGVDCVLEVAGGREDARVDDERVAVGLSTLVVVVGVADGAAVGEEDAAAQVVERLAAVELTTDPPPKRFVGEPAQGVEGAQQLPVLQHGLGERMLAGAGLESGDQQCGRDVAMFERSADPQQVSPGPPTFTPAPAAQVTNTPSGSSAAPGDGVI